MSVLNLSGGTFVFLFLLPNQMYRQRLTSSVSNNVNTDFSILGILNLLSLSEDLVLKVQTLKGPVDTNRVPGDHDMSRLTLTYKRKGSSYLTNFYLPPRQARESFPCQSGKPILLSSEHENEVIWKGTCGRRGSGSRPPGLCFRLGGPRGGLLWSQRPV